MSRGIRSKGKGEVKGFGARGKYKDEVKV